MKLLNIYNVGKFSFTIVIATMLISGLNFAQKALQDNDITKINVMKDKLVKKLLLSEKQENTIEEILVEFFKGVGTNSGNGKKQDDLKSIANGKILDNLDRKQKMKFEIIKEEWWDLAN